MPGVYIAYPFCAQKCTYCNFASGVLPRDLEGPYVDAVVRELRATVWPWIPETVYLGGGTPSRLDPGSLAALLAAIPGRPYLEATLEAAPATFPHSHAALWREAGINRVSLGVQSFVESESRRSGRRHTAQNVAEDVAALRRAGIENFNIDLIAGLPGQTSASWRTSLESTARLAAPHVSVYMLEIDEDSRLGREVLFNGERYGAPDVPSESAITDFYETAVDFLQAEGIERYEISNFARPGFASLHNLKYWQLAPYLGFGADAHSFDGISRWANVEDAAEYVRLVEAGLSPRTTPEPAHLSEEKFFVSLRLASGIRPTAAERERYSAPLDRFLAEGLLEERDGALRLTNRGVLLSNEVFQEFLQPCPQ